MRKLIWFCTAGFMFLTVASLQANDVLVEAKAALFCPVSVRFRDIYSVGGMYGDEISCSVWRNFYLFGTAGLFHASGTSLGSRNNTEITIVPLALGVKQFFTIHCVDLYVGVAPVATYVQIRDHSPYVIQSSSEWKMGGVGKVGTIFNINCRMFLDLFSEYFFAKVDFHDTDGGRVTRQQADLSGWSIGAGIGYRL